MLMCATPASSSAPCSDPDPNRGGGLPPCECDVYHNGAFQCMSRMCGKPWGDINVCYPTRVGHPGTFLNGRFYDNNCDDGQTMCSPWTPPITPATTPPPSSTTVAPTPAPTSFPRRTGDEATLVNIYGCHTPSHDIHTGLYTDIDVACTFFCDGVTYGQPGAEVVTNSYDNSLTVGVDPVCKCYYCP